VKLPRGVALVRADIKGRTVVLVSDRLTPSQEKAARAFAEELCANGCPYISLSMTALLGAIHDRNRRSA
jgi:hypothetical protein